MQFDVFIRKVKFVQVYEKVNLSQKRIILILNYILSNLSYVYSYTVNYYKFGHEIP